MSQINFFFLVECPFKFELHVLPTHHNESKIIPKEKKKMGNKKKLKSCGQTLTGFNGLPLTKAKYTNKHKQGFNTYPNT